MASLTVGVGANRFYNEYLNAYIRGVYFNCLDDSCFLQKRETEDARAFCPTRKLFNGFHFQ